MESDSIISIIAIVFLVALSAYFSATETAFTSLNRIRIKNMAGDGNKRAKLVLKLSHNYDKLLSTILIGNNIVNIAMTAIATVLFIALYGNIGATISTIVVAVIILIFGEISPKSLAKESPEKVSMFSAPILQVFMAILTPINFLFSSWKKLLSKVFKIEGNIAITEGELLTMVEEAETEGGIDTEQSELIQNAIEFNELEANDVLTPRVDVMAIEIDETHDEITRIFRETGFSRVPVYEDDIDTVLGVLNQKDFHNYIAGTGKAINDYVKPVVFVAGSIRIAILLKKMQAIKTHIAVVVDEYGGTEGIVTMEDIIEELVGDIWDEHDEVLLKDFVLQADGSYKVQAGANLEKMFDFFDIEDELDPTTVNGWVVMEIDKLPERGDYFEYITQNKLLKVTVTDADEKKALELIVRVEDIEEADESRKTESRQMKGA